MLNYRFSRRSFLQATMATMVVTAHSSLASTLAATASGTAPIVETNNGKVQGIALNGVNVFKGIRYGADTGGVNRFLPAKEPQKWPGVQNATQWGASCPQKAETQDPFYSWYTAIQPMSEDCLFLNVFTPGLNDNKRRPIMVWLHGGSWGSCAGTAPGFDGTRLARQQDVMVITLNHRLNAFGYFALEGNDERFRDSGSAGLSDVLLALRWIQINADAFGGNKDNVTIFGQSGGAAKVIALMGMPAAHGLFHKAIVQSCSGGMRISSQDEAAQQAHTLARNLGISTLDGERLQQVKMQDFLAAMKGISDPFRPFIDGRNFMRDPFYPDAPATAAQIPLLIGNANTESTYYLQVDPKNFSLSSDDIKRRLRNFLKVSDARVDDLIEAYRTVYPGYDPSELLMTITTDYLFKRNTLKVAALQAASGQSPVYAYVFARETPIQGGRIHSPHTSEVPFIFGTTEAAQAQVGHGPDIEPMTRIMMSAWGAFARSGNPNNPSLPAWERFNGNARHTMALSPDSQLMDDPGGAARNTLDDLPWYEYSISREAFVKG